MAHTKAAGKTKNGRNSPGQRLGIKKYAGQPVGPGEIIVRQNGTKWHPGQNVKLGKDDTIYSVIEGKVSFNKKMVPAFTGKLVRRTFVSVVNE
ncbi:MAG TPA: 50S ribosomal protein L27 [Candidatus Wirthbacteria bacterium]|nr:50S ribosomal protein L27 [Candidatus Wirthbacteria bacterium]